MSWKKVSLSRPCEVCGKPDWCGYKEGVAYCPRTTEPPPGWTRIKIAKENGAIFKRAWAMAVGSRQRNGPPKPAQDWEALQQQFVLDLLPDLRNELAAQLGVTPQSLDAIGCGWHSEKQCWTFPERNARGEVIGIMTRDRKGAKIAMRGSTRGLTIPENLPATGTTLSPEGASDTVSLLTMEVSAVGRFSARGGAEILTELLPSHDLLVLGEHDEKGDGSCPGREGAKATAQKLANAWGIPVKLSMPPDGAKDVRTWLQSRDIDLSDTEACSEAGREFLAKVLESAETVHPEGDGGLHYEVVQHVKPKSRVKVSQGSKVVAIDTVDLASSHSRKQFAKSIASKLTAVDVAEIEAKLLDLASQQLSHSPAPGGEQRTHEEMVAERDAQADAELAAMPAEVVSQAEALLLSHNLIREISAGFQQIGIVGECDLALTIYLVGVSRLLKKPLGAIAQGTSSSGKSFVIELVARLYPAEALLSATDLTPKALFYLPPGGLVHRWVVAGERRRGKENDEHAEATRALREMLSAGKLTKAIPIKHNGRPETILIVQPGPIAFTESTTRARIFDEDANRCLLLSTDESPEQTRRVVLAQAAARACDASASGEKIILLHHAIQRLLRRVHVVVPFAEELAKRIPTDRPEARRAIGHALDLIQAVALLHQRQRIQGDIDHGTKIHATLADYEIARGLLVGPLGRALGGDLPDAVVRFGRRLFEHFGTITFTAREAISRDTIVKSKSKAVEYIRALHEADLVQLVESGKGSAPHLWQMNGSPSEGGALWLPTRDELELANEGQKESADA